MPRAYISADRGNASTGGASNAQRVQVTRPDGSTYEAHAKFAEAAENGRRGLAAEFIASRLAELLGANVPRAEAVELRDEPVIKLRNGVTPAPGLAFASETITPWIDVNAADAITDVPLDQLALLSVHESWTEVSDRGHNMIRSHSQVYAIDFASAFNPAWSGATGAPNLVDDGLLRDRLIVEHNAMRTAADRLCGVTDAAIDGAVNDIPADWLDAAAITALRAFTR